MSDDYNNNIFGGEDNPQNLSENGGQPSGEDKAPEQPFTPIDGEYSFTFPKSSESFEPSDMGVSFDEEKTRQSAPAEAQEDIFSAGGQAQQSGQAQPSGQSQQSSPYGAYQPQGGQTPPPQQQFTPYTWGQQSSYSGAQSSRESYSHSAPAQVQPPKRMSAGKIVAIVVVACVVVLGGLGIVASLFSGLTTYGEQSAATEQTQVQQQTQAQASQQSISDLSTTASATGVSLSAVDIASKVRQSVVGVMTYEDGQLSGEGSGVVMGRNADGTGTYVITCAHVIDADGVTYGVMSLDGKTYEAKLVATDTRTDIGVLLVETTELVAAEFGDSTALQIGETVYAIGNPGGSEYFGSMTDGIVSAIDRSVSSTYNITCIQHNAAINPGNSGGALVNQYGQVIGINSSKIAATDYEGMGFAIPMATVQSVVNDLISYGYVPNRPKLGIEYSPVDRYQVYSMVVAIRGLPAGSLVIAGISSDSSLNGTDAQVGDLIIAVNGQDMDSSDVLLDLIDTGAVGDTLTLTLCRINNRTYQTTEFDVTITLVEDKGDSSEQEETTAPSGEYSYGGSSSFEDFFSDYFGGFGGFGN